MANYTLRSQSQPRLNGSSACPFERLPVQPVGTSDHYLDRCYCYLCTCGLHICPGDLKRKAAAATIRTIPSLYRTDFGPKESVPAQSFPIPLQVSMPSTGRMDLRTTAQMDFRPPGKLPIMVQFRESLRSSLKCVTRSSYQCDFPNWKPGEAVLFKATELPYRGDTLCFKTKSTYQDNFDSAGTMEPIERKKAHRDNGPITSLADFYGQTSHRAQFRRPKKTTIVEGNERNAGQRSESGWVNSPPIRCLTTTYRREFSPKGQPVRIPCKQEAKAAVRFYSPRT